MKTSVFTGLFAAAALAFSTASLAHQEHDRSGHAYGHGYPGHSHHYGRHHERYRHDHYRHAYRPGAHLYLAPYGHRVHRHHAGCGHYGHYPHHYGAGFGFAIDGFSFVYRDGH